MISRSIEQTEELAKDFINKVSPKTRATVCLLIGDLGSGKTTFARAIAKAFNVKQHITSPTFVIMKKYKTKDVAFSNFIHIDAYRLSKREDLSALNIEEELQKKENFICMEWPESVSFLDNDAIRVYFKHLDENSREIIIENPKNE